MSAGFSIGAAIPAYRDSARLWRCLNSIADVRASLLERAVVVDDSGDGRVATELRASFPQIKWIAHDHNRGFGASASEAVRECSADIVILLNDDVLLLSDPSSPLQEIFQQPDVFAVTFQSRCADGKFREGAKQLVWPMGMPRILHNERDQLPADNGVFPSAYAVGGHAAYRKEMFAKLDGFDALFDPFYWEDVDLSVRAQKNGWKTVYCPVCIVQHDEGGAIRGANDAARIREISIRNRLLFARRHLPPRLRPLHRIEAMYRLIASLISGNRTFPRAYYAAQDRWRQFHSYGA